MSSEIRVNSLSSRTGLSTVTFTDTGPIFSGITTFQDNSGFNVGTGGSIFSPTSNTITLGTNSAERLRITSAGNIGIGINNPPNLLTLGASGGPTMRLADTTSGVFSIITGGSNGDLTFSADHGNAGSSTNIIFSNDGNQERLRITSDGKVGINRNNPAAPITARRTDAGGTGTSGVIAEFANSSGYGVWFGQSSASGASWGATTGDFYWNTGGLSSQVERLRITSAGLVGIGSDNPSGKLDIQGNFEGSSNFALRLVNTQGTGRTYGFRSHGTNGEALTLYHGSIRLQQWDDYQTGGNNVFYSGGNESFRINSVGDVGINQNSPTKRLHVVDARSSTYEIVSKFAGGNGTDAIAGISLVSAYSDTANDHEGHVTLTSSREGNGNRSAFTVITADGASASTEKFRVSAAGDVLIGGQTAYTYDDTGASNTILDITNSTNNKRGILSLSGNCNANGPSIGTIWFNNDQNSGTGPGATMKLAAAIQAKAVTSDSNAGDDSGAYLQFLTKPESAALAESMVIHSDGEVTKVKQPGFFARRSIVGDGRAAGAQEWTVSGTGTFNTGSHFNASNGRFTAPVAGRYLFTAAPGYKQSGQNFQFYYRINGGDASEPVRFIDGGDDLVSHSLASGTVIYNLSANDYVDVYIGVTHHVNLTLNFFMGYLLG